MPRNLSRSPSYQRRRYSRSRSPVGHHYSSRRSTRRDRSRSPRSRRNSRSGSGTPRRRKSRSPTLRRRKSRSASPRRHRRRRSQSSSPSPLPKSRSPSLTSAERKSANDKLRKEEEERIRLRHEAELRQLEEETARRLEEEIRKRVEEKLGSEEVRLEIERQIEEGRKKLLDDVKVQLEREKEAALAEARQKEMTGGSREKGKGKEKTVEPRNSMSSNLGLCVWLSRGRGRTLSIREPRDTQSTPEAVPRHLDDTEYDSPSPPPDEEFPPELFIAEMAAAQQQHSAQADVPTPGSTGGSGIGGSATPGGSSHDSRVMIYPRGNEFSHQKLCATAISSIMMCKFEGPYDSFTKVPLDTRDLWFREFELMFRWRPEDSGEIRRIFGVVGGKSLKHKVYKARQKNKRPYWIPASAWADLLVYWASETYKKKAATNKKNRSSDGGGRGFPLHFGGSISHLTHRDRLRERLGRDPTLVEGFRSTHVQVLSDGTERWSDNVSRSLHDSYVEKYDAAPSSDGSSPSVHLDVEIERWTEVAGGEKKGSVPGLAGLVARRHGLHVPLTQQTQTHREEQLQKEVEELRSQQTQYADVRMELQTQNTHLQAQLSQQGQELQAQRREMNLIRQMFAQMQHQQSPLVQPVPSFPIPTPSWPPFNPSAPNVDELNIPPNTDDDHCDEDI